MFVDIGPTHMASEAWKRLPNTFDDGLPIDFDNYSFTNFLSGSPFDANFPAPANVMHPSTHAGPSSAPQRKEKQVVLFRRPNQLPEQLLQQINSAILQSPNNYENVTPSFALTSTSQDNELMNKWTDKEDGCDLKTYVVPLDWMGKSVFVRYVEYEGPRADEDRFFIVRCHSSSRDKSSSWSRCLSGKNHRNVKVDDLGFETGFSICRSQKQQRDDDGDEPDTWNGDSSTSRAKKRRSDVNSRHPGVASCGGRERGNSEDPGQPRGKHLLSPKVNRSHDRPPAGSRSESSSKTSPVSNTPGTTVEGENADVFNYITLDHGSEIEHMEISDSVTPHSIHGLDVGQGSMQLSSPHQNPGTETGMNENSSTVAGQSPGRMDVDDIRGKILLHCITWNGVPSNRRSRSVQGWDTAKCLLNYAQGRGVFKRCDIDLPNKRIWVDFRNAPEDSNPWSFQWGNGANSKDMEEDFQDFLSMAEEHCRMLVAADASRLCEFDIWGEIY